MVLLKVMPVFVALFCVSRWRCCGFRNWDVLCSFLGVLGEKLYLSSFGLVSISCRGLEFWARFAFYFLFVLRFLFSFLTMVTDCGWARLRILAFGNIRSISFRIFPMSTFP